MSRQTYMLLEALSARVEQRIRAILMVLLGVALTLAIIFSALVPLIWSGLTYPDLYAISPRGDVVPLQDTAAPAPPPQPEGQP